MLSKNITDRLIREATKSDGSPFKREADGSLVMMFDSIRVRLDGDKVTTMLSYRGEAVWEATVPNIRPGEIANFVGIKGEVGISVDV